MIYALDASGVKIEAAKGRQGICPTCGEELIARCGSIRVWHWGHTARLECDPWQERESDWHRLWKECVPIERAEVCYGEHRADILAADDCVVELQHSRISAAEIRAREAFYGRMIWLIDGKPFMDQFRVEKGSDGARFSWSPARPSWLAARKPMFIQGFTVGTYFNAVCRQTGRLERQWRPLYESDDILQIRSIRRRGLIAGEGRILSVERFRERMFSVLSPSDPSRESDSRPVVPA